MLFSEEVFDPAGASEGDDVHRVLPFVSTAAAVLLDAEIAGPLAVQLLLQIRLNRAFISPGPIKGE